MEQNSRLHRVTSTATIRLFRKYRGMSSWSSRAPKLLSVHSEGIHTGGLAVRSRRVLKADSAIQRKGADITSRPSEATV